MDREKQREIASKGGRAANEQGTAHRFTSEEARAAGRKGGEASHSRGRLRRSGPGLGSGSDQAAPYRESVEESELNSNDGAGLEEAE